MSNRKAKKNDIDLPILQSDPANSPAKRGKSGRGRIRAGVLIAVHLAILLHLTHYWISGRTLSPVEPSEAMYTIELGHLNAGAIFFGIAILSTMVFGRFFCGWGCHLVALQDLCGYVLRRIGIRPKPLRSRLLVVVPFVVAFYMFCWPTLKRLIRGDRAPEFTNHLMTENFWYTFPGPIVSILTFVVCGGLIVYLLGNKGFCTYACPYGAFFSISDRVAVGRIRVTDDCSHCGQCTAHCTSNVVVHAEVRDFGMVVDPGCMKCMDCVSVCPNDALYFGLKEKPGTRAPKDKAASPNKVKRRKKTYDFSLVEELFGLFVAATTIYSIRGLYDIPPLLLAVAVGVLTAFLTIHVLRIFRKRDVRVQRFQLKRSHRVTGKGRWAFALLCIWLTFLLHSCFVQYHRHRGRDHLSRVNASWTELLDGLAQPKFTPEDQTNIDVAIRSYRMTDRFGILDIRDVKLGLALGSMMNSDNDAAEIYLRQAYDCDPATVREMFAEFLVTQDRQDEAAELY